MPWRGAKHREVYDRFILREVSGLAPPNKSLHRTRNSAFPLISGPPWRHTGLVWALPVSTVASR